MLRAFVGVLIRFTMRTFYRRVDIVGWEKVPPGPVLLVANHYNSLVDPLVIQATAPRWVTFAAAEFLFHGALGFFLRRLGMIPIYRASDRHDPQENLRSFRHAFATLAEGEPVAIFPEGVSHSDPHIQRLRSGAARIALGAEDAHDWRLGLQVVPLGLVYEQRDQFRGQVTVVVGDPIPLAPLRDLAGEKPQRALRQLTKDLQAALEDVTFSQETWDDYRFVDSVAKFCTQARPEIEPGAPPVQTAAERVEIHRRVRGGFLQLQRESPEAMAPLRRQLESYSYVLERLGISDRQVREDYPIRRVLRYLLKNLELMVLGWPIAAWGTLNNLPGYLLIRVAVRRVFKPRIDRASTYKIYPGVVIFLVTSLLQTVAVVAGLRALGWPGWLAAVYLISLPVTGWYAIAFFDRRRQALQSARAWALLVGRGKLRGALRERRARLIEILRGLRAQEPSP